MVWWMPSAIRAIGHGPHGRFDRRGARLTDAVADLAHVSGGGFDAIGATLPGTPAIAIGRNRFIAWGETNVAAETVTFSDLTLVPATGATDPGFCELHGSVSYPQFQAGALRCKGCRYS